MAYLNLIENTELFYCALNKSESKSTTCFCCLLLLEHLEQQYLELCTAAFDAVRLNSKVITVKYLVTARVPFSASSCTK